jgi:hypothetical protein
VSDYPDIEPIWAEFDALDEELLADLDVYRRMRRRHQARQWWRRAYCRAVSAYFEGVTSWMSRYTVFLCHPGILGDDERQTLEARLPAIIRAFHAFDLFTDTSGARTPFERGSPEWLSLTHMINVRNRITHPKCPKDVILTDDDLIAVDSAAEAMLYLVMESLRGSSRALMKRCREIDEALASRPACSLRGGRG